MLYLPEYGSSDENGFGTQGKGFNDVSASGDSTINVHLHTTSNSTADIGENLDRNVELLNQYTKKSVMINQDEIRKDGNQKSPSFARKKIWLQKK